MRISLSEPNTVTAATAGVITTLGLRLGEFVEKYYSLTGDALNWLRISEGILFFIVPVLVLVVGFESPLFRPIDRLRRLGLRAFVFPGSKEDLPVLARAFTWFISAGITLLLTALVADFLG